MRLRSAIRNSAVYRTLQTLRVYASNSRVVGHLEDERTLAVFLSAFLGVGILRIALSGMDATIRFLSFALLFLVVTWLVWGVVRPAAMPPPSLQHRRGEDDE